MKIQNINSKHKQNSKPTDTIRFIVATDIHLGYKQYDHIRKNDSFNAFQQVLSIATKQNVDFLLLGGDLFDQVNPSQPTIYKCLDILSNYVEGQRDPNLKAYLKDNNNYITNIEKMHTGVKLPIFTIHGNHDYPTNNFGSLSVCDLLHVSNYANYFGKYTDLKQINVKPMIIHKDTMKKKIAIYGLGYIKDGFLNSLFQQKKVKFQKPQDPENTFCIFIFHQNRYKKGLRAGAPQLKCINAKNIPQWIDLTIWGHQHQAINKIQVQDDRQIFQPGSTVITSFIQAQAYPKQCVLIQLQKDGNIDLNSKPLNQSYRPMVVRNYQSKQLSKKHQNFEIYDFLDKEINNILQSVNKQYPGRKPIIRLKIQYKGDQIGRCKFLQIKYSDRVANPQSIIVFWKRVQHKIKDDKKLLEQIKYKKNTNQQDQQALQWILENNGKNISDRQSFYQPNFWKGIMQSYVKNQSNHSKNDFNQHFKRNLQKKINPLQKEVQSFQKSILQKRKISKNQLIKNEILNKLRPIKDDQTQSDQNQSTININNENKSQKLKITLADVNKLLILKQNQIINQKYTKKYQSQKNKNSIIEIEDNQQKLLNKNNRNSSGVSEKMQVQQTIYNQKIVQNNIKVKNNESKSRQSILKSTQFSSNKSQSSLSLDKINLSSAHNHSHKHQNQQQSSQQSEDDCCKRAQRTPYNENQTKSNFQKAHKKVQITTGMINNRNNNNKMQGNYNQSKLIQKQKEGKKQIKNKKSVRFTQDDLNL